MLDLIKDLYTYLSAQTELTDHLDVYAGAPAIFAEAVPADHVISEPVLVLDYPRAQIRSQTFSTRTRDIEIPLRVLASWDQIGGYNSLILQQSAEAVCGGLSTHQITLSGGRLRGFDLEGPIQMELEDTTLGARLILLKWRVLEDQQPE